MSRDDEALDSFEKARKEFQQNSIDLAEAQAVNLIELSKKTMEYNRLNSEYKTLMVKWLKKQLGE